jgi:hypothetical protein
MTKLKLLRLLFVAIILMSSHIYICAEEYDVILSATAEKVDLPVDPDKKRTIYLAPPITLHIDGHKFSWSSQFSFCGIELLTEDGTVVFSQPLSGMESSVTIPGTLSGTFTIVMYLGEMVYMGDITI